MSDINTSHGMIRMVERVTFPFTMLSEGPIALSDYFRHIYLEPEITLMDPEATSAEQVQGSAISVANHKLVLTGAMGAGKSTYLLWLHAQHEKSFKEGGSRLKPFIFSLPHYFEEPEIKEFLKNEGDNLVVFIDSLDETVLSFDRTQINDALDFFLELPSVIIACRSPFFYQLFSTSRRIGLDHIIELKPLTAEVQRMVINHYMGSKYLIGNGGSNAAGEEAMGIINRCRKKNVAESTITATPLFSALTSIVAVKGSNLNQLKGVTDVYKLFVRDIIERKFKGPEITSRLLGVAFRLNTAQLTNSPLFLDELIEEYGDEFGVAVQDILQNDTSSLYEDRNIIVDFRHRSIGEYLLARYIVTRLDQGALDEEVISNILGRLFNYEVSFFIRSLFDEIVKTRKDAINNELWKYINNNLTAEDENTVLAVHNCMYFSRFLVVDWKPYVEPISEPIYRKRKKIHPLIMGTFLSGVIGCDAVAVQEKFLKENLEEKLINRNLNYYLFYYGDSEYRFPSDFVNEISETTSWDNTRSVLLTRLKDTSPKKRLFRCHDLIILRQFLERTKESVPPIDIQQIAEILSEEQKLLTGNQSKKLKNAIKKEIVNIKGIIKEMQTKSIVSTGSLANTSLSTHIIFITPNLGYEEGGVNTFNFEFSKAMARHSRMNNDYQVVCIPYVDPVSGKADEFKEEGGMVFSLKKSHSSFSLGTDLPQIKEEIDRLPKDTHLIFVGHDSLTGEISNYLARNVFSERSTSVIFHHMDYQSYYTMKGGKILENDAKIEKQHGILRSAEIVFGVGPKLYNSAKRITTKIDTEVYQLNPGLPDIPVKEIGHEQLVAVTFGRYDKKTDNLKQMKLAATGFVKYVSEKRAEAKMDPMLNIIGISKDEEGEELTSIFAPKAEQFVVVNFTPYKSDRKELFRKLASSSISLMLSVHEGFGIAGQEAIAAGVPLILSQNTGLYMYLEKVLPGQDLKDFGIYVVDILGSMDGEINTKDEQNVIKAFSAIWTNYQKYKSGILTLRQRLTKEMSWEKACVDFLTAIDEFRRNKNS